MADIALARSVQGLPGGVRAVDDLDLTVADGEFFALLGPSGCGKTTLLRTIAGLESSPAAGCCIGDRDVTAPAARRPRRGHGVPGLRAVPAHGRRGQHRLPAADPAGRQGGARGSKAAETGTRAQPGRADGAPARPALRRAAAAGRARPGGGLPAAVFLFDEPLSNLDARLRLEARTFLKKLQRELGVTTVFVTHDQAEALALADRIAVMEAGRIRQLGTPQEVFQPAGQHVRRQLHRLHPDEPARRHGRRRRRAGPAVGAATCRSAAPGAGRRRRAGGRRRAPGVPGRCRRAAADALHGTVADRREPRHPALVTVEVGDATWRSRCPEGSEPAIGAQVWLTPRPGRALLYRRETAS